MIIDVFNICAGSSTPTAQVNTQPVQRSPNPAPTTTNLNLGALGINPNPDASQNGGQSNGGQLNGGQLNGSGPTFVNVSITDTNTQNIHEARQHLMGSTFMQDDYVVISDPKPKEEGKEEEKKEEQDDKSKKDGCDKKDEEGCVIF
jgi:hypothetical protein